MHACPVPQAVPFGALAPVSMQTGAPVLHEIEPTWQGALAGAQLVEAAHAVQAPARQTIAVPHAVPSARLPPMSVQPTPEAVQVVLPRWQGLAGAQVAPGEHARQVPPAHTRPAPHAVPSVAAPRSTQTSRPVVHAIDPVLHGSVGVQAVPARHATQLPSLHTRPVPHAVPSGAAAPVSTQLAPGEHTARPTRQAPAAGTQASPAVQRMTQTPPPVTAAQVVPVGQGASLPGVHGIAQVRVPSVDIRRQRAPGGLVGQALPAVQSAKHWACVDAPRTVEQTPPRAQAP